MLVHLGEEALPSMEIGKGQDKEAGSFIESKQVF